MSAKNEKPIGSVSNPSKVFSNARKVYSNKVQIQLSDRKNKKYKIFDPHKKNGFILVILGMRILHIISTKTEELNLDRETTSGQTHLCILLRLLRIGYCGSG